jgi:MFS family permease
MYGMSSVASHTWEIYVLAAGVLILGLFVKYELGVTYPVLNMRLFTGNATFAFSNLAALINYSATFAVGFLLSLHLQVVLGFNSQTAGLVLLSQPILMALLSPYAGRLSDRVEPRVVSSLGMALTTAGLLVFCFLNKGLPLWLIVLDLAVLGTGFALFSSPNSNAVMGSVEKRFYGVASSTLGTMRLVGQAVSMAIVTLVVTLFIGNVELGSANPEMLVRGARTAFIIFTVLCFMGIFASLKRGNVIAGPGPSVEGAVKNK